MKEAAHSFIEDWDTYAGLSWGIPDKWNDQVESARANFARIIGAKPENIAYMFGNSTAIASIMASFPFTRGDEVIYNDLDFPAIPANLMSRADYDLKYKVARSEDGKTISGTEYRKVISERTKLITACEVVSNTGFRINTDEILEISHDKGIPVFLDTYQSTGTIPMDVKRNDADFLASGTLKYLIGGFVISFLYVRDDWIENLNPGSIGWMGVDNPFADLFDKLRTELHRPNTATKFQFGTPYPFGAYTAKAGIDIILDIGVSRIYEHNMKLTQDIIDRATDRGYELLTPHDPKQRGSIVNIQVDNQHEMADTLKNNNFILDARANGIRVAPHFYNNTEDVDKLFEILK